MSIMKTSSFHYNKKPIAMVLWHLILISCSLKISITISAQTTSICSGIMDNYVCPEEPVSPDPALLNLLTGQNANNPCFGLLEFDNFPGLTKCNGIDIPDNALFIHQLTFPVSGNVTSAILQFRAKAAPSSPPGAGQSNTDFIAFFEGATYITGANLIQLPEAGGTWNPNQDASFTLNLGNLPAVFSQNNILQYLNDGDLDIVIGNETGVDWMCINPSSEESCCTDFDDFCQRVENAVTVNMGNDLCKANLNIGDIGCNDLIEYVDWGDMQIDNGPFYAGEMPMHVYSGSGVYTICYLAIERDSNGVNCFEKLVCDTIDLPCTSNQITTKYLVEGKRCKYTLIPPKAVWKISMKSVDSGGRDTAAAYPYHIETAILKPFDFPAPTVSFTDSLGNPILTSVNEEIQLTEDNAVSAKIQSLSPAPPGYGWYGLKSNPLTLSLSPNPDSTYFDIAFEWSGLPPGSQDSTGAFWMSDDKDDLYQEQITDALTDLDTAIFKAATIYWPKHKNCKGTPIYNPITGMYDTHMTWEIYYKCVDYGGRTSSSSSLYHLQAAVLKPVDFPIPNFTFTDSLGNPVFTPFDEEIILSQNGSVADKIEATNPAPVGYEWFGLQSNELTPSDSPNSDSLDLKIVFDWLNLPPGSLNATGAFWASDDKDDLYDEFITDQYTELDTATFRATSHYGIDIKNCKFIDTPCCTLSWDIKWRCEDSGARTAASSTPYHLQTAVLKPTTFLAPNFTLTDTLGSIVITPTGEEIVLSENSDVATKIQAIYPAPVGYEWYGLQSNSLTPSDSNNPVSQDFKIRFEWTGLDSSQNSSGAFWASDDKDDLYGELITDAFTELDTAQLVSTNNISKTNSIHLYPNPTSNTLTLEFKGAVPKAGSVQILDLYGRLLERQNLLPGQQKHQLSVADLPAGMYFVRVTDGGVPIWSEKVVKQ